MTSVKLKPSMCPSCGYFMDAASPALERKISPKANDVSMCLSCGAVLVFDQDLSLRSMTEDEKSALPPHMARLLEAMERHRRSVIPPEGLVRDRGSV